MKLLNNTSADELKSSIQCAIANNSPYSRELLERTLDDERRSVGSRVTIIKILEAEIRRQDKAAGCQSKRYQYVGSFGGAA